MTKRETGTRITEPALCTLAIAGCALFATIVLVLPAIKDDYSPVQDAISEGALGRYGYLQVVAFFALGIGSLSLAISLLRDSRTVAVGVLVGVSGICMLIAGAFPTDRMNAASATTHGTIHMTAAALAFGAIISAMLLPARQFRNGDILRPLALPSFVLGLVALALFVTAGAGVGPFGLIQRANAMVALVWLVAVSVGRMNPQQRSYGAA